MSELEEFVGCMIKRDLAKTTLKTYQQDIITKITQGFNKDVKSLINYNTEATPHT